MKKLTLIPTTLLIATTPLISCLSGCSNVVINLNKLNTEPLLGKIQLESSPILLKANTRYKLMADFSLTPSYYPFVEIACQYDTASGRKWGPLNVDNMKMTIDGRNVPQWDGMGPDWNSFALHTDRYHNPDIIFLCETNHHTKLEFTFTWRNNMPMKVMFVIYNRDRAL